LDWSGSVPPPLYVRWVESFMVELLARRENESEYHIGGATGNR
jgi:hypothetical protein